jgi:hypothetical protein
MPGLRGSRVGGVPTDEAQNGVAALNESIVGVVVRSMTAGLDASAAAGSQNVPIAARPFDSGSISESLAGLLMRAAVTGRDTSAPAGSQNVPVEASSLASNAGVASALVGFLANTRINGFDALGSGDWRRIECSSNANINGQAIASIIGVFVNATTVGHDSTGAAVLRPVEARSSVGAYTSGLIGLLVQAQVKGTRVDTGSYDSIQSDIPANISGRTYAAIGQGGVLYTGSIAVGSDTTGAAVLRPVEARDFTADGDVAAALISLLVSNRNAIFDALSVGNWRTWTGNISSVLTGLSNASSAALGANVNSIHFGTDTTGAAVLRAVEARTAFNLNGVGENTAIGLHTLSLGYAYDVGNAVLQEIAGIRDRQDLQRVVQGVYEARDSGFWATTLGRRYSFTHQTPGTLITAQATFVATTPTLLLYNSAGNATMIILRTVRVVVLEATTAPVMISVAIDTADRFSAAGTVITGQNWNEASATAYPGTAFRFNATATAAGAGTRYLWTDAIPTGLGGSITLNFLDGIIVNGVGSILIYCWDSAGANAADIVETVEVEAF